MPDDHDLALTHADLLRFARLQLRNDSWAEDAVSETLLAAVERPQAFAGRAAYRTWLIGILRHKIIDQIRRHTRECALPDTDEGLEDLLFTADGRWSHTPVEWRDPQDALHQQQFLAVMDACLEGLPPQQGRVFLMREWLELETDEICKELSISATNLWVVLHRARLRLRACLEQHWFTGH